MGELGNIWLYQEDTNDLKMKLQSTRMELEVVRHEVNLAKEQTREKEKQLNDILQMVYKERDEAIEQLHNLLNKINPSPNVSTFQPHLTIDSNQLNHKVQHPRSNSSITESNTLSDPYNNNLKNNLNNNHSYVSSPVDDSIFDAVTSSPEFSTFNNNMCQSQSPSHVDHATMMIDGLVKGKILPQKGKLLEAMMEAGPLLQTLMLAGPLPKWRYPPPLQPFKIPQMAAATAVTAVTAPMKPGWTPFIEMSCGSSSYIETSNNNFSMLSFNNGGVNNGRVLMNMNTQIPVYKRQRLM